MAELAAPPQPAAGLSCADEPLTYDQLHERACIVCGGAEGPPASAGHRTVAGLTWAVVTCLDHAGEVCQ
ncbi:hypothetical protein ACFZB9_11225 [Kitasatospora sp. NPDC008050]|uniref:hypothetical protein n=1 Tax=Kitasatospora sp. NPDC008050 TaxID=3364021 RepID=UPI0036E5FE72